jgi:hypothetical protein
VLRCSFDGCGFVRAERRVAHARPEIRQRTRIGWLRRLFWIRLWARAELTSNLETLPESSRHCIQFAVQDLAHIRLNSALSGVSPVPAISLERRSTEIGSFRSSDFAGEVRLLDAMVNVFPSRRCLRRTGDGHAKTRAGRRGSTHARIFDHEGRSYARSGGVCRMACRDRASARADRQRRSAARIRGRRHPSDRVSFRLLLRSGGRHRRGTGDSGRPVSSLVRERFDECRSLSATEGYSPLVAACGASPEGRSQRRTAA